MIKLETSISLLKSWGVLGQLLNQVFSYATCKMQEFQRKAGSFVPPSVMKLVQLQYLANVIKFIAVWLHWVKEFSVR